MKKIRSSGRHAFEKRIRFLSTLCYRLRLRESDADIVAGGGNEPKRAQSDVSAFRIDDQEHATL